MYLIAALSAVAMLQACSKEEAKATYYAPSEVVLEGAGINTSDLSVTLSAVYNGDDSGVASARFTLADAATGTAVAVPDCEYSEGVAKVCVKGLEMGKTYKYNFEITTPGANVVKAAEDETLAFCLPKDFEFLTQTTLTSKILTVSYTGDDEFVRNVALVMADSEGNAVENVPEVICAGSSVKALFNLSEWAQDLYDCHVLFTLYDNSTLESDHGKLNLLPVPENIVPAEITFDETGKWTVKAAYDGEDKTVVKGEVTVCDKTGNEVAKVDAECAGRTMTAYVSGLEYGRYTVTYTLYIVDGSSLSEGPVDYVYAKPREYAEYSMTFAEFFAAGVSETSNADPERFTVKGIEWEDTYLQAKPTKSPAYAVWSSSKVGYLTNITPFEKGIKLVHIIASSGMKDIAMYECYAKSAAGDEWTKLPGTMVDNKNYQWNLSLGDYKFFKFMTTAQGEFRLLEVRVQYYTEDAVEY